MKYYVMQQYKTIHSIKIMYSIKDNLLKYINTYSKEITYI